MKCTCLRDLPQNINVEPQTKWILITPVCAHYYTIRSVLKQLFCFKHKIFIHQVAFVFSNHFNFAKFLWTVWLCFWGQKKLFCLQFNINILICHHRGWDDIEQMWFQCDWPKSITIYCIDVHFAIFFQFLSDLHCEYKWQYNNCSNGVNALYR